MQYVELLLGFKKGTLRFGKSFGLSMDMLNSVTAAYYVHEMLRLLLSTLRVCAGSLHMLLLKSVLQTHS